MRSFRLSGRKLSVLVRSKTKRQSRKDSIPELVPDTTDEALEPLTTPEHDSLAKEGFIFNLEPASPTSPQTPHSLPADMKFLQSDPYAKDCGESFSQSRPGMSRSRHSETSFTSKRSSVSRTGSVRSMARSVSGLGRKLTQRGRETKERKLKELFPPTPGQPSDVGSNSNGTKLTVKDDYMMTGPRRVQTYEISAMAF